MATYGKYEVVTYGSGYAVTNMATHEWMHEKLKPREEAHQLARKLQERDANLVALCGVDTVVSTPELRAAVEALRRARPDGTDIYNRCERESALANAYRTGFQWLIARTPDSPDWDEGMTLAAELLALARTE